MILDDGRSILYTCGGLGNGYWSDAILGGREFVNQQGIDRFRKIGFCKDALDYNVILLFWGSFAKVKQVETIESNQYEPILVNPN